MGIGKIVPQAGASNSSNSGVTQLTLAAKKSSPHVSVHGILVRLSASLTGTAPATARGVSQLINSIVITNDKKQVVANLKGQSLAAAFVDGVARSEVGLLPQYQLFKDTVTGATTVAVVGLYAVIGRFAGASYTIVVNLNAATSTGYTVITAVNYQAQSSLIEVAGGVESAVAEALLGEYFSGTSTYTGKVNTKHITLAVDNAEIGGVFSAISVGGESFNELDLQQSEDITAAQIPYETFTMGGHGTTLANDQPTNPQTGNVLYCAKLDGPTLAETSITFSANETFAVVSRVPLA